MKQDKAHALLQPYTVFAVFHNRHGAKLILAEVLCKHSQPAVDEPIY